MYVFLSKVQTTLGKASSFNENGAPSWLSCISQLPFTTQLVLHLSIHRVLCFANAVAVVMQCAGSLLQGRFLCYWCTAVPYQLENRSITP